MRLTGVFSASSKKLRQSLKQAAVLELHSLKNNYAAGVNKYLFTKQENGKAYCGLPGTRVSVSSDPVVFSKIHRTYPSWPIVPFV